MKAMVLHSHGPVEGEPLCWTELPDPVPASGEILVRVAVYGVCRTDLHVIEAELPPWKLVATRGETHRDLAREIDAPQAGPHRR